MMRVLFVVQEGPDSGITIYANSVAQELRRRGVHVSVDEKYFDTYDIIHIHGRPHLGLLSAKVKSYAPIVTTTHVTKKEFEGLMPDHFLWAADAYLRTVYKISRKIFVTAPHLMEELGKKKSLRDKLVFLAYTVDLNRFCNRKGLGRTFLRDTYDIPPKRKIILCVASIQKRKGIFDFIKTAKKMPQYTFVWVGKVPTVPSLKYRKKIEALVGDERPANVIFTGPLFGDDLVRAFYSADLFWHPSHAETFGLVVVEAAASGLPVLVRDLKVYDQFSDFVRKFKSQPEKEINALLHNSRLLKKLKKSAKKGVWRYAIDAHVDVLLKEYQKIIGGHKIKLEEAYALEKKPIVSVIVPTLNEEQYIEDTLKALTNQTAPKELYEIIVSDSTSSDATVAIARKYADRVVHCKRKSAGHGRNFGAKHAKGKFLAFVDADTHVSPEWVEGVLVGLEKGVAATGPIDSLEKDSNRLNTFFKLWDAQTKASVGIKYPIIPGFNFAVRKKDFFSVKGFSEKNIVVEDMELSLKLAKKGKVVYSDTMAVKSSTRRLKEIPAIEYMLNATKFAVTGKSWGWEKHRKDFK